MARKPPLFRGWGDALLCGALIATLGAWFLLGYFVLAAASVNTD